MKKLVLSVAAAAFAVAGTAQAIMIDISAEGVYESIVADVTTIDFDTTDYGIGNRVGDSAIVSGSVSGQYAAPFNLGPQNAYLTVPKANRNGSVDLFLGESANYFGLFWGSIDAYNFIEFYDAYGNQVGSTISGTTLSGVDPSIPVSGGQANLSDNRYVNIFTESEYFSMVRLISNGKAFETDNHAFGTISVSEPATFALLGLGLTGLVAARRRKA